jgi:hypothetical protein
MRVVDFLLALEVLLRIFLCALLLSVSGPAFADTMYGFGGGGLYTIDTTTGAATFVTLIAGGTLVNGDLSLLNGVLYGTGVNTASSGFEFGTINPVAGAFAGIADNDSLGLAANPNLGVFYEIDDTDLATLTTAGVSIDVGSFGIGATALVDLAYDAVDGILYAVTQGPSLYTVDTSTGAATLVGSLGLSTTNNNGSIGYDNLNGTLYFEDGINDDLYTVNTSTGVAALVGSNGDDVAFTGLADISTPEPATAALIAIGLAGLALRRRCGAVRLDRGQSLPATGPRRPRS